MRRTPGPTKQPMSWLKHQRGYWAGYNGLRDGIYEPSASEINRRDDVAMAYLKTKWRT
jgi:hypothetical protein